MLVAWLALAGCGVAYQNPQTGAITVATFWKDISAEGEITRPDGSKVKGKITSAVNAEQLGTMVGSAIKAAKP